MSKTVDKESTVYISREAVDDVLCDLSERTQTYPFMAIAVAMAIDKIDSIPNADVAPVVHGHWVKIEDTRNVFICSRCGHIRELRHFSEIISKPKLCEECGAKMDEKLEGSWSHE